MTECAWAVLIAAVNHGIFEWIDRRAQARDGRSGLLFALNRNVGRIFGLIAGLVGVILWADINRILFIFVFILLYFASLFYTIIRYGTNG